MAEAYFISPINAIYAVGSGRFSLTDDGGTGRVSRRSRCLLYLDGSNSPTPEATQMIYSGGGAAALKAWGLTWVQAEQSVLTACTNDPTIRRIPFGPAVLQTTFGELNQALQDDILQGLQAVRIDTTWITPTTRLALILRHVVRVLMTCQRLGANFPEADLEINFGSLSLARRNAIRNFLTANGQPGASLTNASTIRQVVRMCGEVAHPPVSFGGREF